MGILDAIARRSTERQGDLVARPQSMRREAAKIGLMLVGLLVASSTPIWAEPGSWADVAGGLVLALFAGVAVVSLLRTKMAYRSGWLDGRAQMVRSLSESMRRGHSLQEWLEGELARDYMVLGLPPELALGLDEDDPDGA